MNRYKIYESFAQSVFFADSVAVPRFLLEHYKSLEITNEELVLVLHLLSEHTLIREDQIALKMGLPIDDVERMITGLQKKRLLKVHDDPVQESSWYQPKYDFSGLMDQLFELWGILRYRQMHNNPSSKNTPDTDMAYLKQTFEQEFARGLSHMDCEHIRQWILAGWSPELITEALRRGVSAGIRTFRYLDSILREWEKKGIRTIDEVMQDDLYFQNKRSKKSQRSQINAHEKIPSDKMTALRAQYEDLYL